MRYLVSYKDEEGQDQVRSFARKTERTKWVRKQEKRDPMVKYELSEESDMSEQDPQVEQVTPELDFETVQEELSDVPGDTEVTEAANEEPKQEPKAEKSPMAGKTVKVRLTMTAEVDYDTFKAYFGYTDEELKNYALHGVVRTKALQALEEFGRNIGESVRYFEAKQ
jgi:hypothetical protein